MSRPAPYLPVFFVVAAILCGLAITGALAVHHTGLLVEQGLHDSGVPFVGNNDGYFYLDQARALAGEGKGAADVLADSRRSMLLPYLLSPFGEEASSLHLVAAYLGPLLGLSMLLAVLPWAMDAGSRFVTLTSSLLALLAPYWISRTHVAVLDTDSLAPGLCLFALFCLYRCATGENRRLLWCAGYLLTLAFLWLWWQPGALVCSGFIAFYLIYPAQGRIDRGAKILLTVGILGAVGLAVSGFKPLAGVVPYVAAHLKLAFGGADGFLVSSAISELKGVSVAGLGEKGLGSAWLLLAAAIGTAAYCYRFRWAGLFLASTWAFGVAALVSQRFIPLFIPAGAFFVAYGLYAFCTWAGLVLFRYGWSPDRARAVFLAAVLPVMFWGAVSNAVSYEPKSYFSRSDFELAETVRTSFPRKTTIWTWWDYGYFFQYLTGMDTYFDGGSQTDVTCFVAAHPLMQADEARAAAWIRHFSASSWKQLDLGRGGKEWPDYLDGFEKKIGREGGPGVSVALVLPARVYTTTGYLHAFAHVFEEERPAVSNHLDLFAREGFNYAPGGQSVVVPQPLLDKGYDSFGAVLDATGKSPVGTDFSSVPDPYLVFSDTADFLAVTDRVMVDTVLFRLLGLFSYDTQRFEPVSFDYRSGGVWRVR